MSSTVTVAGRTNKNITPPKLVRAEANILRYPIFYLHTKGLATIDTVCCQGERKVDGKAQSFKLTASRNSLLQYPGPFSRKVFHALMSLLQKNGLPYSSFIEFTWRQLAKEMQISWNGKLPREFQKAIQAIAGLLIISESALIDGDTRQPINDAKRGFTLVDQFIFTNSRKDDGTIADRNRVVFADWLIQNLNAKYFAAYRYDVWLGLVEKSVIASRLYEYLIHSFSGHHKKVDINYARLCQFLPVKEYKTLYSAQRQLQPAFDELVSVGVLASFRWGIGAHNQFKILLKPGGLLRPTTKRAVEGGGVIDEKLSVTESHNEFSPSEELVRLFHQKWNSIENKTPSKREIVLATSLIEQYGRKQCAELLRYVLKILKVQWPDARLFTATKDFWPAAIKLQRRQNKDFGVDPEAEKKRRDEKIARRKKLRKQWQQLSEDKQQEIVEHVYATENEIIVRTFDSNPKIREMYLLNELERRL